MPEDVTFYSSSISDEWENTKLPFIVSPGTLTQSATPPQRSPAGSSLEWNCLRCGHGFGKGYELIHDELSQTTEDRHWCVIAGLACHQNVSLDESTPAGPGCLQTVQPTGMTSMWTRL